MSTSIDYVGVGVSLIMAGLVWTVALYVTLGAVASLVGLLGMSIGLVLVAAVDDGGDGS